MMDDDLGAGIAGPGRLGAFLRVLVHPQVTGFIVALLAGRSLRKGFPRLKLRRKAHALDSGSSSAGILQDQPSQPLRVKLRIHRITGNPGDKVFEEGIGISAHE